ncbi:MAG: DUF6776 family protein [Thiolinea sp.]
MSLEYRFDHRGNVELQSGRQKRSLCWLYFLLFILLQLGVATWLYFSGYLTPVDSEGSVQALSLRGKMDEQERLIAKQSQEIVRLESQVATAQRAEAIQSTSNAVLRDKLVLAETELAESREHLLLYEEILSPQSLEKGLNIRYLDIKRLLIDGEGKKLAHDRYYQYHLILTNVRGDDALVKGKFSLSVRGEKDGKSLTLKLKELVADNKNKQQSGNRFALKYYQGLEGNIELPEGFKPQQVTIVLIPVAGKKVTRQYSWDAFELAKISTTSKE